MKKVLLATLPVGALLLPVAAIASAPKAEAPPPATTTTVQQGYIGDRMCAGLQRSVARRGIAADPGLCNYTSVFTVKDGPREVVGRPFGANRPVAEVAAQQASRCSANRPYKRCRFHVRQARDYHWRICKGYSNHCRNKDASPIWYKIKQRGRYWRGETCWHSIASPYPHDCRSRYGWTKGNNWRRGSFRTGNRRGNHHCQRVSSSGVETEIGRCWVSGRRDPFDIGTRYSGDKWRADRGLVGMRWCFKVPDARQTRCGTSWIWLKVGGRIKKGGSW